MQKFRPRNFIQASKSIAFSCASLLGCNKSVKCIVDEDGNFELTSSVLRLLQAIDVEHPAISIIHDVCQALHKYHGAGCATMIFMVGSWLQSFETLLDEKIPSPIIHRLFGEALTFCLEEAEKSTTSLADLGKLRASTDNQRSIKSCKTENHNQKPNYSTSNRSEIGLSVPSSNSNNVFKTGYNEDGTRKFSAKRIVSNKFSRHLMDDMKTDANNVRISLINNVNRKLSIGLSRGNEIVAKLLENLLNLVVSQKRSEDFSDIKISTDSVFTQMIENRPNCDSRVFEGLCISTNTTDIDDLEKICDGKLVKICLIDFDLLAHSAEHLKRTKTRFNDTKTRSHDKTGGVDLLIHDPRPKTGFRKLLSFAICCVIFKGEKSDFVEECQAAGIIAIKVSSYRHLQALSDATENVIISSIDDLDQTDIGLPVKLSVIQHFRGSLPSSTDRRKFTSLIAINLDDVKMKFITVTLCATTRDMVRLLDELFWSAFGKLWNVLDCGKCIKGCGETELRCAEKLRLLAETKRTDVSLLAPNFPRWMSTEIDLYRQAVYFEVARGLERFCSQLKINTQNTLGNEVLDDVISKTEAWKRAMNLVKSITRVDMVITTGIDEGQASLL